MDPLTEEEERKRLLLERFQTEVGCPVYVVRYLWSCLALFISITPH